VNYVGIDYHCQYSHLLCYLKLNTGQFKDQKWSRGYALKGKTTLSMIVSLHQKRSSTVSRSKLEDQMHLYLLIRGDTPKRDSLFWEKL
jgi:hypothetical protein